MRTQGTKTTTATFAELNTTDMVTPIVESKNAVVKLDADGNIDLTKISDCEKERYQKLNNSINVKDINSIVNYGSDIQQTMNRSSNALLSAVRNNQTGTEISSLVDNLLSELSCIDIDELEPKSGIKQFLRKIPIIKHLVVKMDRLMQKYDTVEKNVQVIADKIAATRIISLRDNTALQKMFQDNLEYIKQLEELIIAGKFKQEEVLETLNTMLANPNDYEAYEISDMQEFANSLDKKLTDMLTLRYVMKQSLPQIRLVQNNNLQTANKAQSIIATTIPVWKNQLSLAVALNNQRNGIIAQRKVSDATNEIMKRNAEMLRQNSIDVAKENERMIIETETLRQTTQQLIDTIREVKQIHEQGNVARREAESELLRIESELETTMQITH